MKIDFETPVFELDEEVWVICGPNHIMRSPIRAFQGLIFKDRKNKTACIAHSAKLSSLITDYYFDDMKDVSIVPLKYLTKDEDKARGWMKVYPVLMIDEEWLKAIGKRPNLEEIKKSFKNETFDSESSIDDSELGTCCANMSDIRDCLIRCQEKGGLTGWEREDLQWKINNSYHTIPENHVLLDKIFGQLEIRWNKENE